jgi:hypothetical protein
MIFKRRLSDVVYRAMIADLDHQYAKLLPLLDR